MRATGIRATGIGSMPSVDGSFAEATSIVVGEFADFPHLVELPGNGPGADMLGRVGAMLSSVSSDLSWETTPPGWRQTAGVGIAMRRAHSMLGESLDALEERLVGYAGEAKAQFVGPWTFASSVYTAGGSRILRDAGFVKDVTHAMVQAVVSYTHELQRRIPGASWWIQVDEPALTAVLNGDIPNSSGLGRINAADPQVVSGHLSLLIDAVHQAGAKVAVHTCAANPPWSLLLKTGVDALSFDVSLHRQHDDDHLGALIDQGKSAWLGLIPTWPIPAAADGGSKAMDELRRRLGFDGQSWAEHVVVTPTCGFGMSDISWTRAALAATQSIVWQA